MSSPRRGRRNPLIAIGAVVSLAGLSYLLYQKLVSASQDEFGNGSDQTTGETFQKGKKQKYKPTLSLCLPVTFTRDLGNMMLLEGLLSMLSQSYLITLIAPPPRQSSPSSPQSASTSESGGIESVAALSQSLSHISGFDSRRVLEYSKEEGRLALARALACDAHCEVMLESVKMQNREGSEDGDRTPRATTPEPFSTRQQMTSQEEDKVAVLEQYHADMARIRKSSSLLIFLILPIQSTSTLSGLTVAEMDAEIVIQPFLLPGQQELSSRVPGVKVVDERSNEGGIDVAWSQAARRVVSLSKGWQ